MRSLIYVGLGGVLGSLARYGLTAPLNALGWFPLGTLAVNLWGSFLLALFLTVALKSMPGSSLLVLGVATGFIGSFTTFSALSVEAVRLAALSPSYALLYVGVSFVAGLALTFAGRLTGRYVLTVWGKRVATAKGAEEGE